MNIISRAITSWYDFKSDITVTKIESENKIDKVMLQKFENKVSKLGMKDKIDLMELQVKQSMAIKRKAVIYNLLAIICTVISTGMTILGVTQESNFFNLFKSALNITYMALIIITQFAVFYISANSTYLKAKFYNNYKTLSNLQAIVLVVSIVGNIRFLATFTHAAGIDYLFIVLLAIALDMIGIAVADLANNAKYRNYSFSTDLNKDINLISMLTQVIILPVKTKLKHRYLNLANDYRNIDIQSLTEVKQIENNDMLKEIEKLAEHTTELTDSEKNLSKVLTEKTPSTPDAEPVDEVCLNDFNISAKKLNIVKYHNKNVKVSVKKSVKKSVNSLDSVIKKLTYIEPDKAVSPKSLNINISRYEWQKIRFKLMELNLVYTKGTLTYKAKV